MIGFTLQRVTPAPIETVFDLMTDHQREADYVWRSSACAVAVRHGPTVAVGGAPRPRLRAAQSLPARTGCSGGAPPRPAPARLRSAASEPPRACQKRGRRRSASHVNGWIAPAGV